MAKKSSLSYSCGVLTVGSPQLKHCLAALAQQTPTVHTEIVSNVAPYSAAFNHLQTQVTTDYLIKIDEDMELLPAASQLMHRCLLARQRQQPQLAQLIFKLWDPLLGVLSGVKIFDLRLIAGLPMQPVCFPDRQFAQDLHTAGLLTESRKWVVGFHARHRTPYELFLKCAIAANKAFQESHLRVADDLHRFHKLQRLATAKPNLEGYLMKQGLAWGSRNPINTDLDSYPWGYFQECLQRWHETNSQPSNVDKSRVSHLYQQMQQLRYRAELKIRATRALA